MSESIVESGGNKFATTLGKKLGPLPVWAWAALIAILAWAVYLRTRSARVAPSAQYVTDVVPDSTGITGAGPAPNTNTYDGVNLTSNGRPLVSDNGSWAAQVSNELIASGKWTATIVSNALDKYLSGKPVTEQEAALINIGIQKYGQPPSGVLPINVQKDAPAPKAAPKAPAPAPKAAPKAPAPAPRKPIGSWYTVKPGDSLSLIAQRFYGSASSWSRLWNHAPNKTRIGTGNPDLIHPGVRLWIPAK